MSVTSKILPCNVKNRIFETLPHLRSKLGSPCLCAAHPFFSEISIIIDWNRLILIYYERESNILPCNVKNRFFETLPHLRSKLGSPCLCAAHPFFAEKSMLSIFFRSILIYYWAWKEKCYYATWNIDFFKPCRICRQSWEARFLLAISPL